MDKAHEATDALLLEIERKIRQEYSRASREVEAKLQKYLKDFKRKDLQWRADVRSGKKTAREYKDWKIGQLAIGQRWEEMKDSLARDYVNANNIAKSIVLGYMPEVYALNHNYATYECEKGSLVDTSYTLYSRESVERIMRDNPQMLPLPGKAVRAAIAQRKAIAWNKQQIQSVMMQAILQGESIPKIARRLAFAVGDKDYKHAVTSARTMATGAQNAGRVDAYKRAEKKGIKVKQQWIATLDGRTRHEHRILDGQMRNPGEPFEVEGYTIRFPGDPQAEGFLVYNCRCTLIGQIEGFERDVVSYRQIDPKLGNMTYEEWEQAKPVYKKKKKK